jgi:DNA-binding winged helix-turn-helix (wHTH) protein
MHETSPLTHVLRFGVFEADLHIGELRKQGLKIKLHGQPMEVLGMLLEHPGELVTREEIQKRLWAANTFIDFEHSLNTAIKKLREALGDDADNPRFIETLPRRGYRFIYPVAAAPAGPAPRPATTPYANWRAAPTC